jgi:hypothetical protein
MNSPTVLVILDLNAYTRQTTKFYMGDAEGASSLLGILARFAMRLGLHRDPSHFVFSPWIVQMRRRMWGHFAVLDNQVFNGEGVDSGMSLLSDVQPPINANDDQFPPSRFLKPEDAPNGQEGFTDMTFILMRAQVYKAMQVLHKKGALANADLVRQTMDDTEAYLKSRFINHMAGDSPMERFTISYNKVNMMYMRVFFNYKIAALAGTADADVRAKSVLTGMQLSSPELTALQVSHRHH